MAVALSTPTTWTFAQLLTDVLSSELDTIYWLQRKGLLKSSLNCSRCSSQCRIVTRKGSHSWRCPRKGCQAVTSIREESFFSKSRLSLKSIIILMYLWSRQVRVSEATHEAGVSEHVAIDWYNFFRNVCGKVVEIDELKFGNRGVKQMMRKQGVMNTSKKLFPSYVLEYLWRQRFKSEDLFEKLIECIVEQYVL